MSSAARHIEAWAGSGAIVAAHCFKAVAEKVEMFGFFVGGLHPVIIEAHGHGMAGEPCDDVPVQVHRIQFDMRQCVKKGDPPLRAAGAPARNLAWRQKIPACRARRGAAAARPARSEVASRRRARHARRPHGHATARSWRGRRRWSKDLHRHLCERRLHSVRAASRTSAACPSTLTLRQIRAIRPVPVDQEGCPLDPHELAAIHVLLDPDAVVLAGSTGFVPTPG